MIRTFASLIVFAVVMSMAPLAQASQKQEPKGQVTVSALPGARPARVVNLNTATLAELEQLPGVGTKTAELIIEYRQKKGPFKKIEELMNVKGIGEKSFLKLKPQLTVATKPEPNTP